MITQHDDLGLALTSEEVDDALNFGMTFDDDLNGVDTSLPNLDANLGEIDLGLGEGGSLGTRSPSPDAYSDQGSSTSTGSKRSRTDFGGNEEDEQSSKRMMSSGGPAMGMNLDNRNGKQGDTALSAIRLDREREGRCPDCGLETHSIIRGEKTPLNVEGEVLNGRCLFCHPLEEGGKKKAGDVNSKRGAATKSGRKTEGLQGDESYDEMKFSFQDAAIGSNAQFMANMCTPQEQQRRNFSNWTPSMKTPRDLAQNISQPTPVQSRRTPSNQQGKMARKHSWKQHVKLMNTNENGEIIQNASSLSAFSISFTDGATDPGTPMNATVDRDDASRSSQYSRNSQLSDGIGHLGKAMAAGMGMACADAMGTPQHNVARQNSKSPHPQSSRRSPKMRDPPTSSCNNSLAGSDGDVPHHVRLAHNKLPSSIYHHHLFPMSKETEQAYIEKTLAYLESGGGDICDVIVAMRRFPFSLPIQSIACEKLYVHCFDSDHAHAIGLVGGVRTVIDAMEHHSKDIALQRGCAGIIKHMATASKYNLDMLDKMGAVRIIVGAMERNSQCAPLLESCCWALGSMARGSDPEIKMRVAKNGGIHAAMNAVEAFPRNESLLRAAFHCLQQLGYNPASYTSGQNQQQQNQPQQPQSQSQNPQMLQQNRQQLQQHQQQLQRMMSQNNNCISNSQMQLQQQQQLQRMMSQNGGVATPQMQMNPQQQLLSQRQQQMLALAQAGGGSTNDMMGNINNPMVANMRMSMMGNMSGGMGGSMGNSLLGCNMSNSMTGNNDSNSLSGSGNNRRM